MTMAAIPEPGAITLHRHDVRFAASATGQRSASAIAAVVYVALVLLMWAPYTALSGLGYETAFPYMSETASALQGFLYRGDPLRIHTNTFYQLSYLLGEAFGVGGSYVPYQIVHALLWWARGVLI